MKNEYPSINKRVFDIKTCWKQFLEQDSTRLTFKKMQCYFFIDHFLDTDCPK
jgi:hypothetical protein